MPKPGDFGVVRTNGWAAWLIRFGTKSTVNHAFLAVSDTEIVEAQPGGAVISPIGRYPDAIWSDLPLTDSKRADIAAWGRTQVGVPYGWLDIIALALASRGIRFKWVRERIHRDDREICSQLVAEAYEADGLALIPGRWAQDVTPGDLLDVIQHKAVPANY